MKYAHLVKSKRRNITNLEWAEFLGISRHTVRERIKQYDLEGGNYDAYDIYSVLRFYAWYLETYNEHE